MRECELDHNCNPIPAVATGVSNPFTFFNTCHSPAFFYLESNICRERSIYNVHPPYHLSHSTPDSESNRRTAGGLTVSIRTIREQGSQLTARQTFPGLSVLFSILSELTINPFEDPHLFLTDCQGLGYGWYRWKILFCWRLHRKSQLALIWMMSLNKRGVCLNFDWSAFAKILLHPNGQLYGWLASRGVSVFRLRMRDP